MTAKTRLTLGAIGAFWIALAAPAFATNPAPASAPTDALLARGRYLVEHVGMCADCHSPRDEKGQFVQDKWLKGSPLAFQPTVPMPWSPAAPAIAGLPSMTTEQAVHFLQTGVRADGSRPLPPMPQFRFGADDAQAVVAYLKSLQK
jgi:mono/diheme cytochrome c family protein